MWQRKTITYNICIPPISKPFTSFSSDETKAFFKWYIDKIPERIRYLSKKCSDDLCINENKISLLPDSLVLLWKWFLNVANTEKSESNGLQLDLQTEYIIRDIGMFLGEVFNTNHKCIHWSYFEQPTTDLFVNRPLLTGFKDNSVSPPFDVFFEPVHMVRVQACKLLTDQQKEDDLLNLYKKWAQKIP